MSLDISDVGRPHFHGLVIVPREVTAKVLDDKWKLASGMSETGPLWDRVKPLQCWHRAFVAQQAIATSDYVTSDVNHLAHFERLIKMNVSGVVSYVLKGGDRRDHARDRNLPRTLLNTVRSRPASEFVVYAKGVSIADIDLDEHVAEASSITQGEREALSAACELECSARNRICPGCSELLSPVRAARAWDADSAKRPKVRRVRIDRVTCGDACRQKLHRDWASLTQAKLDAVAW